MTDIQLTSATHLIAVSQATKNDIIRNIGIHPDKISVIYEGYNQKLFKPVKDRTLKKILEEFNLRPQSYFLFVGTIQPRKNLERLIKAFSRIIMSASEGYNFGLAQTLYSSPDFHRGQNDKLKLVLAGSKGWLSDEIYTLPKKLGIEKQVKFLGYVPDEKLPALYSGAIAFLFPSLFEGFGLPILEAFACGCPVLSSNISSMPEIAGKAAILVNPYSIDDIAKELTRIMNNELRIELIKKGLRQTKKFSWDKTAQETLKILEKSS